MRTPSPRFFTPALSESGPPRTLSPKPTVLGMDRPLPSARCASAVSQGSSPSDVLTCPDGDYPSHLPEGLGPHSNIITEGVASRVSSMFPTLFSKVAHCYCSQELIPGDGRGAVKRKSGEYTSVGEDTRSPLGLRPPFRKQFLRAF